MRNASGRNTTLDVDKDNVLIKQSTVVKKLTDKKQWFQNYSIPKLALHNHKNQETVHRRFFLLHYTNSMRHASKTLLGLKIDMDNFV